MDPLPVAIESSAQREAAARVERELRDARVRPFVWTARLFVALFGAPLALVGVSAGMVMARQEQNSDELAQRALAARIEQRVLDCIRRSDDALPEQVRVAVAHDEAPRVECVDGACPAFACVETDVLPLVRQAPFGFAREVTLDFASDRMIALDEALTSARRVVEPAGALVAADVDGAHLVLSCAAAPGRQARVPLLWRPRLDVEHTRAALATLSCGG